MDTPDYVEDFSKAIHIRPKTGKTAKASKLNGFPVHHPRRKASGPTKKYHKNDEKKRQKSVDKHMKT